MLGQIAMLAQVGCFFMGNAQFVVMACISYSHSNTKNVLAMGDLV